MHKDKKLKAKSTDIDVLIGNNLKNIRRANGLTQEELSNELGISFQQFQKYEKGKNRISASYLYTLSISLNISIEAFFIGITDELNGESPSLQNDFNKMDTELIRTFKEIKNSKLKKDFITLLKSFVETDK